MDVRRKSILTMPIDELFSDALIVAVLLFECSFFFMDFLPNEFFRFCNYNYKYLTAVFSLLGLIVVSSSKDKKQKYCFAVPIVAFQLVCFGVALSSSIYYQMSLGKAIIQAFTIITIPMLYFDLHLMVKDNSLYSFFIEASIAIAAFYAFLCIMQSFGMGIMNDTYQFFSYRNDRLRLIMSGDFISYGALLTLGRIYGSKKHRFPHIMLFVMMLFELFWVAQTRFFFIGLAAAAIVGFIIEGNSNKGFKIAIMVVAIILILLQFSDKITSVLFPEELAYSGDARVNAYPYYWSHAFDMGFFGLGYAPRDSYLFGLVYLGGGVYRGDITDIGIIGFFARYGIMGAIVIAISCWWLFRCFGNRNKDKFSMGKNPEAWMMLAFWVTISPTMAITDPQRIFYLPILALLVEHALISPTCDAATLRKRTFLTSLHVGAGNGRNMETFEP